MKAYTKKTFIVFQDKPRRFWHITTIENLPNILKIGLIPSKNRGGSTELCISKKFAKEVIKFPYWVRRRTKGYVLLELKIPYRWVQGTWHVSRCIRPRRIRISEYIK